MGPNINFVGLSDDLVKKPLVIEAFKIDKPKRVLKSLYKDFDVIHERLGNSGKENLVVNSRR